ncbi:MAG: acetolactate synthase small subunit [Candidatus Dormibacteraceae bacterium]
MTSEPGAPNRPGPDGDGTRVLSLLLEDHPGALFRVSGLIRRRGFNIQSLSVGRSAEPGLSRMSLTVDPGHAEADQVGKQLDKLIDVLEVADLTAEPTVSRELAVAKIGSPAAERPRLLRAVESSGGRVVDVTHDAVIVELAADAERIDAFVEMLRPHGIEALARTGPVVMKRG